MCLNQNRTVFPGTNYRNVSNPGIIVCSFRIFLSTQGYREETDSKKIQHSWGSSIMTAMIAIGASAPMIFCDTFSVNAYR